MSMVSSSSWPAAGGTCGLKFAALPVAAQGIPKVQFAGKKGRWLPLDPPEADSDRINRGRENNGVAPAPVRVLDLHATSSW